MDHIFQTLTNFAVDPFKQLAAAEDPQRALCSAGLSRSDACRVLNGTALESEFAQNVFDSCETCVDPGDDPDSFD